MSSQNNQVWTLSVLEESPQGFLVMSPNGDTQWMTREQYESYLINSKKLKEQN
jgi:hypothetical protein